VLTKSERETILTICDDEEEWHVYSDGRLTRRLITLAEKWGRTPEREGSSYRFFLPLAAIRFASPRKLSEAQRATLRRHARRPRMPQEAREARR